MQSTDLNLQFQQIEQWLLQHASKIVTESLKPPARIEQLNQLEEILKKPLPDDFKALYLWHDGMHTDDAKNAGNLFYGLSFFDIDFVRDNYIEVRDSQEDELYAIDSDPEINGQNHRNPLWLKFGHDWSRCSIAIDLNPVDPKDYGQVVFIDYDFQAVLVVAPSITALVETFVSDLQQNKYYLVPEALEDDTHFIDAVSEIDLLNWSSDKCIRFKRSFK